MEHVYPQEILLTVAYRGTIHNSQKVEVTETHINWWTGKQNAVYPYSGILLSNQMEQTTNRKNNMNKAQKH